MSQKIKLCHQWVGPGSHRHNKFDGVEPGSYRHNKFKMQSSAGKVTVTVFWDATGVTLLAFFTQGSPITGVNYANFLKKKNFYCLKSADHNCR